VTTEAQLVVTTAERELGRRVDDPNNDPHAREARREGGTGGADRDVALLFDEARLHSEQRSRQNRNGCLLACAPKSFLELR
jgi:hypothetical protein